MGKEDGNTDLLKRLFDEYPALSDNQYVEILFNSLPSVQSNIVLWDKCSGTYKNSIRTKFKIPQNEIILAVFKTSGLTFLSSAKEQVVLTEKGIYTIPNTKQKTNRITYGELPDYYVLTNTNDYECKTIKSVSLYKDGTRITLISIMSTGTANTSVVRCIYDIVVAVQLLPEEFFGRLILFDSLYDSIRKEQKSKTILSDKHLDCLWSMLQTEEGGEKAAELLLNDAIYWGDFERIIKVLKHPALKKVATVDEWLNKVDSYFIKFTEQILSGEFTPTNDYLKQCGYTTNSLVSVSKNVEEVYSKTAAIYNKHIVRLVSIFKIIENPSLSMVKVNDFLKQYFLEDAETFLAFATRIKNEKMKTVYEMVLEGQVVPKNQVLWVDGFGLTTIHYYLMNDKAELIYEYIKKLKESEVDFTKYPAKIEKILDYKLWAINASDDSTLLKMIAISPEISPFNKELAKYDRLITLMDAAKEIDEIRRLTKGRQKSDEELNVEARVDDMTANHIAKKNDVKAEMVEAKENLQELWEDYYKEISNTTYGIEGIVSDSFSQENYYYHNVLNYEGERVMVDIDGIKLYLPSGLDYGTDQNLLIRTDKEFRKAYGDRWFSVDANNDEDVLKAEYRVLSSKYHPDLDEKNMDAYLDIKKERALILKKLHGQNEEK